ncbi:NAD-dependent epimerase/dehydratase family protein [Demequina sp. NBRC 110053]|uniref:NAD-dependent epimerase/dehydratase family protein n=1 Tax=Demequina sp. NBRC 110053 TaxID=1570342 RepID=UPI001185FC8A|nr:NAD-dependent epimerase/dehydratase family protein [Demequina sp. NBRC 110053]
MTVVGASGNAGSEVLRALGAAPDVDDVRAVARRVPRTTPPAPYDRARWHRADVSTADTDALAEAFAGADAVVHLAWAIQPSHDRGLLRRTNVDGTARMLAAARTAGVRHVVVASSVGAYAPAHDDTLHDESWPATGHPTSEYSVDKADVEALLDAHERDHPEITVTRIRPALTFQRQAGAEIARYFLGRWVPQGLMDGRLPVLPWPTGMRLQVVHAEDVASAVLAIVRTEPGGAFNLAADGVLRGEDVSRAMAGGRRVEMPVPAVRAAVSAAWNARVLPMSPGWIDMAAHTPLVSTENAHAALGWRPTRDAQTTLHEMVVGLAANAAAPSPPLRR